MPTPKGAQGRGNRVGDGYRRALGYADDAEIGGEDPEEWAERFKGAVGRAYGALGLDWRTTRDDVAILAFARMIVSLDHNAEAWKRWGGGDRAERDLNVWAHAVGLDPETVWREARAAPPAPITSTLPSLA